VTRDRLTSRLWFSLYDGLSFAAYVQCNGEPGSLKPKQRGVNTRSCGRFLLPEYSVEGVHVKMKKQSVPALILMLSLVAPIYGQRGVVPVPPPRSAPPLARDYPTPPERQQQQQKPDQPRDDDVVRITTNLVQVDAVVTDRNGKVVPDLRAEDFEILENGKPQQITNFSFISTDPVPGNTLPAPSIAPPGKAQKMPSPPPAPLSPLRIEQARRTFALVVDDGCMSFSSTNAVRDDLKKFVDEQMQPGDLVAIFRSRDGSGALQQFTSDRNQLYRAIKAVRWLPSRASSKSCRETFEPALSNYTIKRPDQGGAQTFEDKESQAARERIEDLQGDEQAIRGLGTLRYVVRGLQELPGRKSVVYISDGLPIFSRAGGSDRALASMRRLVDLANRASVVLYTMDARGIVADPGMATAADDVLPFTGDGGGGNDIAKLARSRSNSFSESRNGLNYLAAETGGLFIHDTNKLNQGLRRVLDDQRGYYLIGYRPTEFTRKQGSDFRKLTVKVKGPGLRVRHRYGFYGPVNDAPPAKPRTGDSQLYAALALPFMTTNVRLRLTAFFGNDRRTGSFMRSVLNIDVRDVTFTDEPNGWKKLALDVAAVTFGENGRLVDEFNRTHTIRVDAEGFRQISRNGLVYSADLPIKKAGAYQLRMVVRDNASKRFGSASQFIEVPEFKKDNLALSGLVVGEANPNAPPILPPSTAAESALSASQSSANLAARAFHPETVLSYGYLIYNPRLDPQTHQPKLSTQVRLFREGQLVVEGPETSLDPGQQTDLTRLQDDGLFKLNKGVAPGEYVLQIIVKDLLSNENRRTATQWIDFEVVK